MDEDDEIDFCSLLEMGSGSACMCMCSCVCVDGIE
jgi:hypothetical protein